MVEQGDTRILVDGGFSARELTRRLANLALSPRDLAAVVITHEHKDHWLGVSRFSRQHGLPVWLTPGTHAATLDKPVAERILYSLHEPFAIGDLQLWPYPVPHDAREPAQLVIGNGQHHLGIMTDTGHITAHVREMLTGCDGLIIEANHDPQLLASGPYPPYLKQRVRSRYGHLSNAQAARFLADLDTQRLQHVVAAHISEANNKPDLVQQALATALSCTPDWIGVASQAHGLGWRSLCQS